MHNASTESHANTRHRQLQTRTNGKAISVSDHVSCPSRSARNTTCTAPFLACSNSIMQGEDGVARCNSPFLYCDRYVYPGDALDAGSSSATKNLRESMIGTK